MQAVRATQTTRSGVRGSVFRNPSADLTMYFYNRFHFYAALQWVIVYQRWFISFSILFTSVIVYQRWFTSFFILFTSVTVYQRWLILFSYFIHFSDYFPKLVYFSDRIPKMVYFSDRIPKMVLCSSKIFSYIELAKYPPSAGFPSPSGGVAPWAPRERK